MTLFMFEPADMYIFKGKWRLPKGFNNKKEFRSFLGREQYIVITKPHYSKNNSYHFDILEYDDNGKVKSKLHFKADSMIGKSFVNCLKSSMSKN